MNKLDTDKIVEEGMSRGGRIRRSCGEFLLSLTLIIGSGNYAWKNEDLRMVFLMGVGVGVAINAIRSIANDCSK